MNLLFVSSCQYPEGGAAANRHLAYAKGLVELNNKVTFILISDNDKQDRDFVLDGINFISASPVSEIAKKSKLRQLYSSFRAIKNAKRKILALHSREIVDAVILLDTYFFILYPFIKLCHNLKIKIFHERTEYPLVVERKGALGKIHNRIYTTFILPGFDGIYVISNALRNYFIEITRNKIPVSILNMVVDPSRFTYENNSNTENLKSLVYCGSMDIEKDGVDILIRSFGKAINRQGSKEDLRLTLIGDVSNSILKNKLDRIVEESGCSGRVIFTGLVTRQRIPELLNNAHALALSRPDNKQAEGGFPTKLGEYLTTGKPVIITDVGEIGLFLKDGENAFVANPGSIDSFSDKIVQVFDNYPNALKIGLKGRDLVFSEFNYQKQAQVLIDFIKTVLLLNHKVQE